MYEFFPTNISKLSISLPKNMFWNAVSAKNIKITFPKVAKAKLIVFYFAVIKLSDLLMTLFAELHMNKTSNASEIVLIIA